MTRVLTYIYSVCALYSPENTTIQAFFAQFGVEKGFFPLFHDFLVQCRQNTIKIAEKAHFLFLTLTAYSSFIFHYQGDQNTSNSNETLAARFVTSFPKVTIFFETRVTDLPVFLRYK